VSKFRGLDQFSFAGWLGVMEEVGVRYAIRLNAKAKGYLEDGEGKRVALRLRWGEVHLG
jgi:hypothetical protein